MSTLHEDGPTGETLLEAMLRLHGDYRKALKKLNVTPLQAAVLLHLHRNDKSLLFRIAEALSMSPPTLTPLIYGLVNRKLVRETKTATDRRIKPLILTATGQALVPRILKQIKGIKV